jgi:ATP-dependent Clp protease ATP-binding subunit ClpB
MAAEDFNESKYTEAAWAAIAGLTKAADFYETSTVEAPLILEIMLNPTKHGAGEDAEAAKRVVEKVLGKAGVNLKDLRSDLEKFLAKQPRMSGGGGAQKSMGRTLQRVLEAARLGKSTLGDAFVSTEGLLLGLVKEDTMFTQEALVKQGVKYNDVLQAVKETREKKGSVTSRSAENMYDALMKYGIDFTEKAREGKLDPVIGRDNEIRRAIQILSRRTKNNPVLIGKRYLS